MKNGFSIRTYWLFCTRICGTILLIFFLLSGCRPILTGIRTTANLDEASSPSVTYSSSSGIRGVSFSTSPVSTSGQNATLPGAGAYTLFSGVLPAGLSLNSSTGIISGTPTQTISSGTYRVAITNSAGLTGVSPSFSISISEDWSDNDNSTIAGFAGGTLTGTYYDTTYSFLRLDQTATPTNHSELDSGWAPQWSSLISYWKLNNNWNDSVGSNHGSAVGAATFTTTAKLGSHAANFDGNPNYMESVGPTNIPNGSADRTICAWIKPSGNGGTIFSINAAAGQKFITQYYFDGASRYIFTDGVNGGNNKTVSQNALSNSSFSHVCYVLKSGAWEFYVNGLLFSNSNFAVAINTSAVSSVTIGYRTDGAANPFDGVIDDVAIWAIALTPAEIQFTYSRQYPKYAGIFQSRVFDALGANAWDGFKWVPTLPFGKELTGDSNNSGSITAADSETSSDYSAITTDTLMNNLIGLWHLNESSATAGAFNDFSDSSGNSHHAENSGTVTFGAVGKFYNGLQLAGDANATVPYGAWLNTDIVTLSMWIMPVSIGGDIIISSTEALAASPNNGFGFRQRANGKIWFTIGRSGSNDYAESTTVMTPFTWYHLVGTYDKNAAVNNLKLYVNGINESTSSSVRVVDSGQDFQIGAGLGNAGSFSGIIDEVAIWNRELTQAEIGQLFRRGANQTKLQIRVCTTSDCSDNPIWLGPSLVKAGTAGPYNYFTEIQNNTSLVASTGNPSGQVKVVLPELFLNLFTGFTVNNERYFQYQIILESDDTSSSSCDYGSGPTWCSPEVKSITVSP